jgi:NADPH:quinone reductase-like Zn-dependent oxidoreductase
MLHVAAEVRPGQTILVLGANGGVGNTLVQLARRDGIRVIGTASKRHHDALRALGAEPVDYRDPDMPARVRELAPKGVDAVFDHVGGPGIVESYRLLARGGTLVSYGTAATRNDMGSSKKPVLALIARLLVWNLLPNGHKATFFNFWAGRRNTARFQAALRDDLTQVFALLARGEITPQIAARLPLTEVARAMRLAESGTVAGKVVLLPQR